MLASHQKFTAVLATAVIRPLFRPIMAYVALFHPCRQFPFLSDVGQSVKIDYGRFSVLAGVMPISGPEEW